MSLKYEPSSEQISFENDQAPKAADLDRDVAILLSETDTFFILDIHSACVADDHPSLEVLERECCVDNLLVRIHFIIVMIWWAGLSPWEFEFLFQVALHLPS